jgi:hypothetical protein
MCYSEYMESPVIAPCRISMVIDPRRDFECTEIELPEDQDWLSMIYTDYFNEATQILKTLGKEHGVCCGFKVFREYGEVTQHQKNDKETWESWFDEQFWERIFPKMQDIVNRTWQTPGEAWPCDEHWICPTPGCAA